MNYMLGTTNVVPEGVCRLGAILNVPNPEDIQYGFPQAGTFPANASFAMSANFRKDTKLADVLNNMNRFTVVSERFKDLLEKSNALKGNEVHEVAIFNHKKLREKAKYFLIHQLNFPRCADAGLTVGEKDPLNPVAYGVLTKLVLDESKIDPELAIFRAAEYPERAFFRRDIVTKIQAAGFTGIKFHELEGFRRF
jgi:hypothetical protein